MNTQSKSRKKKTNALRKSVETFKNPYEPSRKGTTKQLSAVRFRLENGQEVDVPVRPYMVLGRQENNERQVDVDLSVGGLEGGVSRTHAIVQVIHHKAFVRDFNSLNGTTLNGEKLYPMRDYHLQNGDKLTLGRIAITVYLL